MLDDLFGNKAKQPLNAQPAAPGIGQMFSRPNMLAFGAGVLSDNSPNAIGSGLANMGKFAHADQQKQQELAQVQAIENKTAQWLIKNGADPDRVNSAVGIPGALTTMFKHAITPKAEARPPASVQEYEYAKQNGFAGSFMDYNRAKGSGGGDPRYKNQTYFRDPETGEITIGMTGDDASFKRIDTNGLVPLPGFDKIDLGTGTGLANKRTGEVTQIYEKDTAGKARQTQIGKAQGEAIEKYQSLKSKMPGLQKVVTDLDVLAEKATYTLAGQARDSIARQSGFGATEGALARTQYISMVDNQVLPLLRDTFGAAFTVKEGETLRNTLGDPDKSPKEKQAVLKSFIDQKTRDLEALAQRTGNPLPQDGGELSDDDLLRKYGG